MAEQFWKVPQEHLVENSKKRMSQYSNVLNSLKFAVSFAGMKGSTEVRLEGDFAEIVGSSSICHQVQKAATVQDLVKLLHDNGDFAKELWNKGFLAVKRGDIWVNKELNSCTEHASIGTPMRRAPLSELIPEGSQNSQQHPMNQTMEDDTMKEAKENPRKRKNKCDDKENENGAKFQIAVTTITTNTGRDSATTTSNSNTKHRRDGHAAIAGIEERCETGLADAAKVGFGL